jgi:histone deacetylase 11
MFRSVEFDFIMYNGGTDIMKGDQLGNLNVEPEDIILRDEMVFSFAQKLDKPIIMMLSGGYQFSNARNISDSIKNLHEKFQVLG